jgi:hypothetical protein
VVPVSRPSFSNNLVGFLSPNGPHDLARIGVIEHAIRKHAAIIEIGQAFVWPFS